VSLKNIFIIVLNVMLVACLYLIPSAHAGKSVKFSSVYTDLKTECRSALTKAEEKESERLGQDIPLVCKGYGGYEISLASHGAMTFLVVRKKTAKDDEKSPVQEMLFISDPIYTRKVEWRLADGVPFAVIFRRDLYDDSDPSEKKKIGEVLRVVGLKDERINYELNVKTSPYTNEEARRLADNAYAGGR
jgi:hypothetical protein